MPQMGVSVSEGTIIEWRNQVGDSIAYEETICEISTDKIDTEVPSPAAGQLAEILVAAGETAAVGTPIATIATGTPSSSQQHGAHTSAGSNEGQQHAGRGPANSASAAGPSSREAQRRYPPVVQRIAAAHDVDLARVVPTGRNGRVCKRDVLAYLTDQNEAAAAARHSDSPYRPDQRPQPLGRPGALIAAYESPAPTHLSRMRRSIGEHMKRSLDTAATCTTWIEVDFTNVQRARRQLRLTALPIVARCTAQTLADFRSLNAWLEDEQYTVHTDVNLGIAVSLGEDGLIVPVIRSAQLLSVEGLGARIRDLATRAREHKLVPDEVQGGTFTITNPGQYGSIMATPVISQPQVAILDVEAVVKRPVVLTDEHGSDSIAVRPICTLGLSWDHRALDGTLAAQFLAALKQRIERDTDEALGA